jgi:hypothetical protein
MVANQAEALEELHHRVSARLQPALLQRAA